MAERILRRPDVEARTGLSRSTIYDWMKRGEFPKPVALGAWRSAGRVARKRRYRVAGSPHRKGRLIWAALAL